MSKMFTGVLNLFIVGWLPPHITAPDYFLSHKKQIANHLSHLGVFLDILCGHCTGDENKLRVSDYPGVG